MNIVLNLYSVFSGFVQVKKMKNFTILLRRGQQLDLLNILLDGSGVQGCYACFKGRLLLNEELNSRETRRWNVGNPVESLENAYEYPFLLD